MGNHTCLDFTAKQLSNLTIANTVTASIAILACSLAITIITSLKLYRKFVYRLVLYLMLSSLVTAITFITGIAPVHHDNNGVVVRKGMEGFCKAAGFIDQYMYWVFILVICWIIMYLLMLAVLKTAARTHKFEVCIIVFILVFPITFNWVPFIQDRYGLAGPWCWIKLTKRHCHVGHTVGLVDQFTLYYGPGAILAIFAFVSFIIILIALCKGASSRENSHSQQALVHQRAIREALPLLVYPIIFGIIHSVEFGNRLYYAMTLVQQKQPSYPLWVVDAVIAPTELLFPPLAFLLHPSTLKKLIHYLKQKLNHPEQLTTTAFVVSDECSYTEQDPLIIRGTQENNDGYQSIFEETIHSN